MPVQSNDAAWATSTSSPSRTRAPASLAAAAVAGQVRKVDERLVAPYARENLVRTGVALTTRSHLRPRGGRRARTPAPPAERAGTLQPRLSPMIAACSNSRPSRTAASVENASIPSPRTDERVHRRKLGADFRPSDVLLVRRGDVRARLEPVHDAQSSCSGATSKRLVAPVEPARCEGGVLHSRRQRMADRRADQDHPAGHRRRGRSCS